MRPRGALLGLAALSLASLAACPPAMAVEWTMGGSVSQSLQAETNRDLDPNDSQPIYGGTTSFGVDLRALTPTTQWQFETGASAGYFGGSGDTSGLNGSFPNFAAAVSHNGEYVDSGASFAVDYEPVAFSQLDNTGRTQGNATQLTMTLSGDAAYPIDPLNSLSLGAYGQIIRFPSGTTTLDPTTDYGTNLSWGHQLSATTQGNLTFGVSRFTSQGADQPQSLTFSFSGGVGHEVNARLSVNASLGLQASRTTQTLFGQDETGFSVGPSGSVDVAWQPAADTHLVFALSHGLSPTSFGELQNTTAAGAGLQHAINDWTSTGISVFLQRQTASGGFQSQTQEPTRLYGTISPNISFSLTQDWALRASYTFSMERQSGSNAFSNGVFMTITRAFDILP